MGKSRNGLSGGEYGSGDAMSPHEEASKMLEAALIEMDGIIAGTVRGDFDHPGPPPSPFLSIHQAAERLKLAIQQHQLVSGALEENGNDFDCSDSDERDEKDGRNNNVHARGASAGATAAVSAIDAETRQLLLAWLTTSTTNNGTSASLELEARAQKLEGDRNALQFQVSLLQDQVDSQQHKIRELERTLDSKRAQLLETEEALNRELTQRSAVEAHKLDLMTDIGNLHIKMSRLDRENLDLKDKLRAAEITSLKFSSGTTPSTATETTGTGSPRFRGDQHQFMSLPRPGKDVGSRTAGDSVDTAGAANVELNSSSRPPVPPRSTTTQISSANANVPPNANDNDTDWPPKDLAVRRPTTPTLDRARERVVHSCSPSRSLSDAGASKHKKGIRGIFSKMKKSSSATPASHAVGPAGNGDVAAISKPMMMFGDFQRGGVRSTAGPRLGWSKVGPHAPDFLQMSSVRPSQWNTENICLWLGELGLGAYVPAARNWMQTGEILLTASSSDLEKHLGIRNLLHRKKILLGIERLRRLDKSDPSSLSGRPGRLFKDLSAIEEDPSSRLDSASVLRWLSDVGLGQYRETFTECRVDGPMLDNLTVEEATHWLKITNFVHFLGLRSGIRVLREVEFDLTRLIRTPDADDPISGDQDQSLNDSGEGASVANVESLARWTNARLMDWLRSVDLAEFAVNLNGSGVHGGLLVHEDRFNTETLACVLSIPSSKTLLRRHLSLQFAALVGKSVLQAKREAETSKAALSPLSPTTKIKVHKPQFGLLKKKHKFGEFDPHDLVCPPTPETAESTFTPGENRASKENTNQPTTSGTVVTSNELPETTIE